MQDNIPNLPEKIKLKKKKRILDPVWTDYFTFSKRERNGLMVFIFILIVQCIALYGLHFFPVHREPVDPANFEAEFERLLPEDSGNTFTAGTSVDNYPRNNIQRPQPILFVFDPNTTEKEDLEKLGLSAKQSATIVNFVSRGGKFRRKEDLKKVYGVKLKDYNRLEPFINLPDSSTYFSAKKNRKEANKEVLRVDLANADSLEILKLPGIGPGFTHRILAYRFKLGGFSSIDQLHEVWGFTDSLFAAISPNIFLSDSVPSKPLLINTIAWDELKLHPYVGYKLARIIVNYRDQHGAFQSLADFRSVPLITEENFRKLAPYLKFRD